MAEVRGVRFSEKEDNNKSYSLYTTNQTKKGRGQGHMTHFQLRRP